MPRRVPVGGIAPAGASEPTVAVFCRRAAESSADLCAVGGPAGLATLGPSGSALVLEAARSVGLAARAAWRSRTLRPVVPGSSIAGVFLTSDCSIYFNARQGRVTRYASERVATTRVWLVAAVN